MAESDVISVDEGDRYHHIRFRDPDDFEEIRTPDWADHASDSVSEGSEVRMGQKKGSENWKVQAVLIKKQAGDQDEAVELAEQIVEKINS